MKFCPLWKHEYLEDIMLGEIEKNKYHMISLLCGNKKQKLIKSKTNEQTTKQKQTHRHREQTGGCWRGDEWSR